MLGARFGAHPRPWTNSNVRPSRKPSSARKEAAKAASDQTSRDPREEPDKVSAGDQTIDRGSQDESSAREKSSGHGTKTSDKWHQ